MIGVFILREIKYTNNVVASGNNTSLFKLNLGWKAIKKESPTKDLHIGRNVTFPYDIQHLKSLVGAEKSRLIQIRENQIGVANRVASVTFPPLKIVTEIFRKINVSKNRLQVVVLNGNEPVQRHQMHIQIPESMKVQINNLNFGQSGQEE